MDARDNLNTHLESMTETQEKLNEVPAVKVYDPPARRTFPAWFLILILALALVTTWVLLQAAR